MSFVQITEKRWDYERVPIGETPVVELELEPNQRVVSCELRARAGSVGRVTEDWVCTLQIETRLEAPDA